MSMNAPDTAERRGVLSGRRAASECAGDSRLQGLTLDIRPKPLAAETRRGSVALGGLPLSDIGLDDPAGTGGEPKVARSADGRLTDPDKTVTSSKAKK
ncbi:hypothetical protein [Erwinia aphidicola]|uniref:hypothetical protein n=1 Tax=Erwinia aphidicola TaxID=68334 RepID=UPI0030196418